MTSPPTVRQAIIIGAGPAGLTAALELLRHTDIKPIVIEASHDNGGISKTINYKGNRIDIGGHRFFSKSDRVMAWWQDIMPIDKDELAAGEQIEITYQNQTRPIQGSTAQEDGNPGVENTMLVRNRVSRIFFGGRFYDYPISLSVQTIRNLGIWRTVQIGISYFKAVLFPIKEEKNLEQFLINHFGYALYSTFFRDYTEKVWGLPCAEITAEWGAQRIKGLSISKALLHAVKQVFRSGKSIAQKSTETSLIERFLYPKYGPGQMWDCVAEKVRESGGEIHYGYQADQIALQNHRVSKISASGDAGNHISFDADYCISTMPIRELMQSLSPAPPEDVSKIATGLVYRDFITVGLLVNKLKVTRPDDSSELIPDNWIYIQEPHVKLGRLQIFNNWSPYMVANPDTVWIGLEFFCNEGDTFWLKSEAEIIAQAVEELDSIRIIESKEVIDHVVIKMPKSYPAYFGSYDQLPKLTSWTDQIQNLFLVGRNGMHKYNNQDHSMLVAMTAVENIRNNRTDKANIWSINTEEEYHESKEG